MLLSVVEAQQINILTNSVQEKNKKQIHKKEKKDSYFYKKNKYMKLQLFKEFKEFAVKGNMIDIAIGVIIGGAFNKVIDVLVKEVFLPPLSLLTDGINWSNKKLILREAVTVDGVVKPQEVAIAYGKLFEVLVDFVIIGFTVFLVVKFMNSFRNKAEDPKDETVVTPKNIQLLSRMTELLEQQVAIAEKNATNDSK